MEGNMSDELHRLYKKTIQAVKIDRLSESGKKYLLGFRWI